MARSATKHRTRALAEPKLVDRRESRWQRRWPLLLIVALVLATYSNALFGEFTTWDDDSLIYRNPLFNPPTMHSLWVWWTAPTEHLWNPMVSMVQGFLALFPTSTADPSTGTLLNPYLFHATNIILHLGSTLIVYQILRRLRFASWPACAGALVFALHPLQVESVAWASALKDVLYGFFSLLAILAYLLSAAANNTPEAPGGHRRARNLYLLATVLFLLAALSKVTAIMVPVVVMSLILLDPKLLPRRRTVLQMGFWLLISLPLAALTKHWQPMGAEAATALWQRPLIATDTLAFYLFKLFWPAHLLIDYGRDPHKIFQRGWAWWTWIVPAAVGILMWLMRKRATPVVVGVCIFTVLLIPVLGLSAFDFQTYSTPADRYVYLSMFGVAIAAAWAAQLGGRRATLTAILLLATLSVRSYLQTRYWRNSYALYMHEVEFNPDSIAALGNGAAELFADGKPEEAIEFSLRAKRLRPNDAIPRLHLAALYAKTDQIDKALEEYRACYPLDRQAVREALTILTADLGREARLGEARQVGKLAVELAPQAVGAHLNYGSVLGESGDRAGALRELRSAIELDPTNVAVQSNLATMLAANGQIDEAIQHYREALRIDPNQSAAAEGLDRLLANRAAQVRPTSRPNTGTQVIQ
jgi:tetratricopeptide (TPR) repeat protein